MLFYDIYRLPYYLLVGDHSMCTIDFNVHLKTFHDYNEFIISAVISGIQLHPLNMNMIM